VYFSIEAAIMIVDRDVDPGCRNEANRCVCWPPRGTRFSE
jgi:hypothetical protein